MEIVTGNSHSHAPWPDTSEAGHGDAKNVADQPIATDTGSAGSERPRLWRRRRARGAWRTSNVPEVCTIDELAELLRMNRKTLYAAIQRGEIEGVRWVGGTLRAHTPTVLRWLSQGQGRVPRSTRKK